MTAASRAPSSLRQKLGLVGFGLFLTVLALEVALRLGGFIVLLLQEHRNAAALQQKGAYRILCIGESTTQGQYPPFLERALNSRNLGIRFSVIDRGLDGTNTSILVNRIESDLDTYHPDMVVAMMGINDTGPHMPYEPETSLKIVRLIRTLRTYKLARIAWLRIASAGAHGRPARPTPAQETTAQTTNPKNDLAYRNLGWAYRAQGKFADAEAALKKALELDSRNDDIYADLGGIYDLRHQRAAAAAAYRKALEINPRNDRAYERLAVDYRLQGRLAEAAAAYVKALEINPWNRDAYAGLGWITLWQRGTRSEAQEKLEKSNLQRIVGQAVKDNHTLPDRTYGALATAFTGLGDIGLARRYQQKAEELRLREFDQATADNYHRLHEILERRGVQLVCMQYPMHSAEPLRRLWQGRDDGVIFVDNEHVFKDAVRRSSLQEYFADMFAGDFGHCTDKGNELLAGNIADVLTREVFRK